MDKFIFSFTWIIYMEYFILYFERSRHRRIHINIPLKLFSNVKFTLPVHIRTQYSPYWVEMQNVYRIIQLEKLYKTHTIINIISWTVCSSLFTWCNIFAGFSFKSSLYEWLSIRNAILLCSVMYLPIRSLWDKSQRRYFQYNWMAFYTGTHYVIYWKKVQNKKTHIDMDSSGYSASIYKT